MQTRVKSPLKLFPVDSDQGAVCIGERFAGNESRFDMSSVTFKSYVDQSNNSVVSSTSTGRVSKEIGRHTPVTVLPNGFYFYRPMEHARVCDRELPEDAVLLRNAFRESLTMLDAEPVVVDTFIDPTLITCVNQRKSTTMLAGVNTNRDQIYTYQLLNPDEDSNQFRIITENFHDRSTIGTCLYTCKDEHKIIDFCGKNKEFAILLDDGTVRFGEIYLNKLEFTGVLKQNEGFQDGKIFMTASHLVLHSPANNKLRIWERSNTKAFKEIMCPSFKSLNLSRGGKYLIGVSSSQSLYHCTVHCIDVHTLEKHELQFKEQIDDIVISNNSAVFIVMPNKSKQKPNSIVPVQQDIRHLGNINALLANKHDLLSVDSTYGNTFGLTPDVAANAVMKQRGLTGLFGKGKKEKTDTQANPPKLKK